MEKVYCKDCMWCDSILPLCNKEDEEIVHIEESCYEPEQYITKKFRKLITDKNRNNDCKDFSESLPTIFFEFIKRIISRGKDKQRTI